MTSALHPTLIDILAGLSRTVASEARLGGGRPSPASVAEAAPLCGSLLPASKRRPAPSQVCHPRQRLTSAGRRAIITTSEAQQ